MKSLHKKIGVVVLSGLMLLGLSQGFVSNAISISSSNNQIEIDYNEFENYMAVVSNEYVYKYESKYLGKNYIAKNVDLKYPSGKREFLNGLKRGDLDKYRKEKESIIIQVGKSCFKILFSMPKNQRDRIIVNECSKEYGFDIKYSSLSSVEVGAWIRSNLKQLPQKELKELLKDPNKPNVNYFEYGSSFRAELELKKIKLEKGKHYRFRVGSRDYVIYKK